MNDRLVKSGSDPRREQRTRRAFILWMAAYALALALVAIGSLFGPPGITDRGDGQRTQQARVIVAPQSSLAERLAPVLASFRVDG